MKTALLEFPIFNQMTKVVVNYRAFISTMDDKPKTRIAITSVRTAINNAELIEFDAIVGIACLECEKLEGVKGE